MHFTLLKKKYIGYQITIFLSLLTIMVSGVYLIQRYDVLFDQTHASAIIQTLVPGTLGTSQSMAIAADGFARMAFEDNLRLKFVQCTDTTCTTPIVTVVDNTINSGSYASMVLGSDGFARIAYYYAGSGDLKFARCLDASCSTANLSTVESLGDVGLYTAIAMGNDGLPRIVYYDNSNKMQRFAKCLDADCNTSTRVISYGFGPFLDVGQHNSMVIGTDGFARISTYAPALSRNVLLSCLNDPCSSVDSYDGLTTSGQVSSVLAIDGQYPAMVYKSIFDNNLRIKVQCTLSSCPKSLGRDTIITPVVGTISGIKAFIGGDGFLKIIYIVGGQIKYISFEDEFLEEKFIETLGAGSATSLVSGGPRPDKTTAIIFIDNTNNLTHLSCDKYTTCQTSNGPVAPANIFFNKVTPGAQSGTATLTISDTDFSSLVFSAEYTDPEGDATTKTSLSFWFDETKPEFALPITSPTYSAKPSGIRTSDIPFTLTTLMQYKGLNLFPRVRFYDANGVAGPFSTMSSGLKIQIDNPTTPFFSDISHDNNAWRPYALRAGDGFMRYIDTIDKVFPLGGVYFTQCLDGTCTNKIRTKVAEGRRGDAVFALGSDGFARMVYHDFHPDETGANYITFARCTDVACSTKITNTLVNESYQNLNILLGNDGFARIIYQKTSTADLKLIRCLDDTCSTNISTLVETTGNTGYYPHAVMGLDGFPRILFDAFGANDDLTFLQCQNDDCTIANRTIVKSGLVGPGFAAQLARDSVGNYVVLYFENESFRQIRCTDQNCATRTDTLIFQDTNPSVTIAPLLNFQYASQYMALDALDRTQFFYRSNILNHETRLITCGNIACSSLVSQFIPSLIGSSISALSYGNDTYPRIYTGWQQVRCTNPTCSSNTVPTAPTTLYSNTSVSGAQSGLSNPTTLNDTSVVFSAVYNDGDVGDTANKYRIQVSTDSGFSTIVHDTGAAGTSIAAINAGGRSSDITLSGFTPARETTYYWRINFWDAAGGEGAFSTGTNSFFIADTSVPTLMSSTPVESTVDVVVTTPIRLTFRDTIGIPQTTSVNISVNAQQAVINGVCQPAYTCTITPSGSDLLVDLSLNNASLAYSTNYRISYSVGDNATTPNMLNGSFLFTTAVPPTANNTPTSSSTSPSVALPTTNTASSDNSNAQIQNNENAAHVSNSNTQLNGNGNSIHTTNTNTFSANSNSNVVNNNSNTYSSAGGGGASPETSLPQALQRFTGMLGGQVSFSYGANGLPTPDFVDNFKRVPVCSLLGSTEVPKPMFADAEDEPLASYIATIISSGIHIEQDHDTFAPQATITRAEFLKYLMLGLCADFALYTSDAPTFTDLKQDHPHFFFIEEARRRGLITGYKDNTFKPDQPISRAEALAIMIRAYINGVHPRAQLEDLPFDDVRISNWFAPYVDRALEEDIIVIPVSKQFRPNDILNRAEIASLLAHVLEKRPAKR